MKYRIRFIKLRKKDLVRIIKIRNQKSVRKNMLNKKIISLDEHLNWYKNIKNKKFFHHYVLYVNNKIIGCGYGYKYNKKKKYCYWGIYRDMRIKKSGYGQLILNKLFNKLFKLRKINYIKCQVLKNNIWVKEWYVRNGHQVIRYNNKKNCYELMLKKNVWLNLNNKNNN